MRSKIYMTTRLFTLVALLVGTSTTFAQIDTLVTIVAETDATDESPIAAFGYNPTDGSFFVSSFGSGGTLRRISNLDTAPISEIYATATELQLYYRDGDPDRGVTSPLQSSILLNPQPIDTGTEIIPAYSFAVINDNGRTKLPASTTTDPAATKRFYSYNLQTVVPPGDGRDIFTTLATLADMQAAAGQTSTSSNQGRQGAWSGDGQFMYFADSSTSYTGIWKLDPVSGDIERLLVGNKDTNIEPAVLTSGGVDTIYISGAKEINSGGIDTFTYDGTTVGARTTAITAAKLQDFFELEGTDVANIRSMTTDDEGNVYFNNIDSSPNRRGIFRLDPQGRISKVVGYAERDLFFTGDLNASPKPNSNTLRMQTRTVTHATAGDVTQVMYTESSGINVVAGAYAFEAGDFDRDGDLDASDLSLLSAAITVRGVEITNESSYKFDMNANAVVDWRDVKVVQEFAGFANGDVNFDGTLDLTDLDVLNANYHTIAGQNVETWLDGDIASFEAGYSADAFDADQVNFADVAEFAEAWLNDLGQAIVESDLTSRYSGIFLDDALEAFGFAAETLLGDYNGDNIVNAADYTVWRDSLSMTGSSLAADGYADGIIDENDYQIWAINYGNSLAVSAQTVPEPGVTSLLLISLTLASLRRRSRGVV